MDIYSLTFRDLLYLNALNDLRNFGKAAKACHVSQPALSTQIKKIEGYFEVEIFERQHKSIISTPEGAEIIERVKRILDEAKPLSELLQFKKKILSSELKVGIIGTLASYYPPYFIPKLKMLYPNLTLILIDGYTDFLVQELKAGRLDVLIASEIFTDSALSVFPIFHEPLYIFAHRDHPLAQKESILLNDLNSENMYFLKDGNCLTDEAVDLCPKNKRGHIKEAQINSLETLKQTVAFNVSYAIIPALAMEIPRQLKNMTVIKKFKNQYKVTRKISLFMRKNSARMADYQAFLKVIKETEPSF